MGASVIDQDGLGGGSSEEVDDLGQGQGALGGGGEGVGGIVKIDRSVVVVVEGLSASRNVDKAQLGRRLAGSQSLELGEEALPNATGACSSRSPSVARSIEDNMEPTNDGNENLVRSRHCDRCALSSSRC